MATTGRLAAWLAILLLPAVLTANGCWTRRPVLVPVEGRLTMDGEPLAGKVVCLIPEDYVTSTGAATAPFLGTTREDGSYSILSYLPGALKPRRGVEPGRYVVTIAEPAAGADAGQKSVIPAPYTQSRASTLRIDVSAKGAAADFDLKSRP